MKKLKLMVALGLMVAMMACSTASAQALSFDEALETVQGAGEKVTAAIKEHGPDLIASTKEQGAALADTVREHGPEWWEAAKEGLSNAADKAQEQAPVVAEKAKDALAVAGAKAQEGLTVADEKIGDFREEQETEFWQHFQDQTGITVEARSELTGQTAKAMFVALASAVAFVIPH